MRFAKVNIQRFGPLKGISLQFSPGINYIGGKNEAGKSALLALLSESLLPSFDGDKRQKDSFRDRRFEEEPLASVEIQNAPSQAFPLKYLSLLTVREGETRWQGKSGKDASDRRFWAEDVGAFLSDSGGLLSKMQSQFLYTLGVSKSSSYLFKLKTSLSELRESLGEEAVLLKSLSEKRSALSFREKALSELSEKVQEEASKRKDFELFHRRDLLKNYFECLSRKIEIGSLMKEADLPQKQKFADEWRKLGNLKATLSEKTEAMPQNSMAPMRVSAFSFLFLSLGSFGLVFLPGLPDFLFGFPPLLQSPVFYFGLSLLFLAASLMSFFSLRKRRRANSSDEWADALYELNRKETALILRTGSYEDLAAAIYDAKRLEKELLLLEKRIDGLEKEITGLFSTLEKSRLNAELSRLEKLLPQRSPEYSEELFSQMENNRQRLQDEIFHVRESLSRELAAVSARAEGEIRAFQADLHELALKFYPELRNFELRGDVFELFALLKKLEAFSEKIDIEIRYSEIIAEAFKDSQEESSRIFGQAAKSGDFQDFLSLLSGIPVKVDFSVDGDLTLKSSRGSFSFDSLSTGASQQFFLALRFSLLKRIFFGEKAPILLDDAFLTFDEERRKRAVQLLKELSEEGFQVIYAGIDDGKMQDCFEEICPDLEIYLLEDV